MPSGQQWQSCEPLRALTTNMEQDIYDELFQEERYGSNMSDGMPDAGLSPCARRRAVFRSWAVY
ncbi:MAG TPA: hypothetical protein VK208_09955 [Pyrinomonadaceae bacterium]|nr:hypothetical protein [Pyrinomonadaceae bacterium]